MIFAYFNPYYDQNIFGFFYQLGKRIVAFLTGNLEWHALASDEIQMLVLIGMAASSSLVGSFLILRRMTMLANSLSHTILLGIVLVYLFTRNDVLDATSTSSSLPITAMLFASVIMGLVTAFLTQFLTKVVKLQIDASTGLVFTSLFALGIILVTLLTRNAHIGTEVVMGNVDALHIDDLKLVSAVLLMNLVLLILFLKEFTITTFDAGLSQTLGISVLVFDYLLMVQMSITAVGGFRAVGVLMLLAFITAPPLTARLLTHNLKRMLLLAVIIGAGASLLGVALSRHILTTLDMALSTGGIVVCLLMIVYGIVASLKVMRSHY